MKNTIPWWLKHRRQIYKKRNYLSIEMILRKSFMATLKEYLSTTSLSGVSNIMDSNNTKLQRFMWTGIFCAAFSTVCFYLHSTWTTTVSKPFIVTSESTTFPISEIDFPAVTLCNFNRISKKAVIEYAEKTLPPQADFSHSRLHNIYRRTRNTSYIEILKIMGRLINYPFDDDIQRVINTLPQEIITLDVIKTMQELAPKCEEMLIKCKWAGEDVNCMNIFVVRRTGMGHCCAFNYVLNMESADRPTGVISPVKRQIFPGSDNGLMVVADPMIHDYAYRLGVMDGFQVLLHDARQFADVASSGRVLYRIAQPNAAQFLSFESNKQYASHEVHRYTAKTRYCLFHDELKEEYGTMYSLSACLVRCRIETIHSLCKCIPYYYPSGIYKHYRVCSLKHLRCLNKYKEKLLYLYPLSAKSTAGLESEMADALYCPECMPDCEVTQHNTWSYKVSLADITNSGFQSNFLVDMNLTNKCVLYIFHPTSFGQLHRLDTVAYWFEILSNIGGFAGMMMGFGIFTFVEIFYYMTIRFVRSFYINYKKYR